MATDYAGNIARFMPHVKYRRKGIKDVNKFIVSMPEHKACPLRIGDPKVQYSRYVIFIRPDKIPDGCCNIKVVIKAKKFADCR